jgi:hypothetical protein
MADSNKLPAKTTFSWAVPPDVSSARKLSFSDIANSDSYQVEASMTARVNCSVATFVAILIMVFASWGFGLWWLLVVPILWFAASLIVAMPFVFLRVALAAAFSRSFNKARIAVGLIDTLNYVVLIPATYYGLRYVHQLFF